MRELPDFELVMAYIREQLEAYREDVAHRLQVITKKLGQHTQRANKLQERLENIVDILGSTVDVFLRHDSAMEMQLRVARLWIFLSFLRAADKHKDTLVLRFINATKDSLTSHLAELWRAPLEEVVPIRNTFREELKRLARASGVFD